MKLLITSEGKTMDARVDRRFGRAATFLVVDTETDELTVVDNTQNMNAAQGAGVQAAQNASETGAEAVITGNVGPKAFRGLQACDMKIFVVDECTCAEALEKFKKGELQEQSSANVQGHWA